MKYPISCENVPDCFALFSIIFEINHVRNSKLYCSQLHAHFNHYLSCVHAFVMSAQFSIIHCILSLLTQLC